MKVKSLIVIGCLMACVFCPSVFAQEETPVAELFGGFSFVQRSEGALTGWDASVATDLSSGFAFKMDVGGAYSTLKDSDDSRVGQYNVMIGLQYKRQCEKFDVFVEGLAGLGHVRERTGSRHEVANGYIMAFGGGFDWKISPKFTWRAVQADYMPLRVNGDTINGFRVQTGILIPLGK